MCLHSSPAWRSSQLPSFRGDSDEPETAENGRVKFLAADSSPEDGGDPKEFHAKPWNAPSRRAANRNNCVGK